MAIKASSESPNIPAMFYLADASTHFTKGALLYRDISTGELKEATSVLGNTATIEAISAEDVTTSATSPYIRAYPITGPGQLWVADCNANTADSNVGKAHAMTSATIVNNSATATQTSAGVFVALRVVGAITDKKLLGYFVKLGQLVAT